MTEEANSNHHYKCPHCACIFLNKVDLQKHIDCFGTMKESHEFNYRKTHGRVEHGYGEE
jgi:hypothetical protein